MDIKKNRRLLDENPLLILPTLAAVIGLNEAIVLQQIHFWCEVAREKQTNYKSGHFWVYNSIPNWQRQFSWWSVSTVKRIFSNLQQKRLVIVSSSYNKYGPDRTKWYRPHYEELQKLLAKLQCELMGEVNLTLTKGQSDPTYTRDYTENTSESKVIGSALSDCRLSFSEYSAEKEIDIKVKLLLERFLLPKLEKNGLKEKLPRGTWDQVINNIVRKRDIWDLETNIDPYLEKANAGKYKKSPGLAHFASRGVQEKLNYERRRRYEQYYD